MQAAHSSPVRLPANHLVVFTLESQLYALPTAVVHRVVRMVDITRVPQAPESVLGVISVQGQIIAVVNVRKRFGLPERDLGLSGQLIIAQTARRPVALAVDVVSDVVEHAEAAVTASPRILPGLAYLQGVVQLADEEHLTPLSARPLSRRRPLRARSGRRGPDRSSTNRRFVSSPCV